VTAGHRHSYLAAIVSGGVVIAIRGTHAA